MVFDWRWRNGLGISSGLDVSPPWVRRLHRLPGLLHISSQHPEPEDIQAKVLLMNTKTRAGLDGRNISYSYSSSSSGCCSAYPKAHFCFMSTCSEYVAACRIAVYWLLYFLHEWLRKTSPIDLLLCFGVDKKCLLYLKFGNKVNVTVHRLRDDVADVFTAPSTAEFSLLTNPACAEYMNMCQYYVCLCFSFF